MAEVSFFNRWTVQVSLLPLAGIVRKEKEQPALQVVPLDKPPTPALLRQITRWDGSSQEISRVLATVFEAVDYFDCIKDLKGQGVDPQSYIDSLDQVGACSTTA